MHVFKNGLLKGRRDGGDVEGSGFLEGKDGGICLLGGGHVYVRQGQREKGRGGCGSHGDLGNGGAGKGISYHIFVAGQMLKGCIEFGKEGKVPLLA